jgi:hypothetical protein
MTTPPAGLDEAAQVELEPEREHEQDHAQLGERVHHVGVGDERDRHVGADDEPGQHVAEHDRQPEALAGHRGEGGHAENDREVAQEVGVVVHGRRPPRARGRGGAAA